MKDKQKINENEVGSMESVFGTNDPMFRMPDVEDNVKIKPSCKNCQTFCSSAKEHRVCDNFVQTHIEDK